LVTTDKLQRYCQFTAWDAHGKRFCRAPCTRARQSYRQSVCLSVTGLYASKLMTVWSCAFHRRITKGILDFLRPTFVA